MHRRHDILLVEDDAEISFVFKLFLADEGYRVHIARNGLVALDEAISHPPDLILLDLHMPIMDGEAFARQYRRRFGDGTPIIVITATAPPALSEQIENARVLHKPVELDQLLASIQQSLEWSGTGPVA